MSIECLRCAKRDKCIGIVVARKTGEAERNLDIGECAPRRPLIAFTGVHAFLDTWVRIECPERRIRMAPCVRPEHPPQQLGGVGPCLLVTILLKK